MDSDTSSKDSLEGVDGGVLGIALCRDTQNLGTEEFRDGPCCDGGRPECPAKAFDLFGAAFELRLATWVLDLTAAIGKLTRKSLSPDCRPYEVGTDFRPVVMVSGLFDDARRHRFGFEQPLDHAGPLRRVESTSYITALAPSPRARAMRPVRDLLAGVPERIRLPYVTDLYTFWLLKGPAR